MNNTTKFDPNAAAQADAGLFGLPYRPEEAKLIILPIPWEATTSYGSGTAKAPQAILQASRQVDLYDFDLGNFFQAGIAMAEIAPSIAQWNATARQNALVVIDAQGIETNTTIAAALKVVNEYSDQLNHFVYQTTKKYLAQGKLIGLLGGDHSIPFGGIQAILEQYPSMGILHIDAHADLRRAYEGFTHSHASIMYNVIDQTALSKLVQVGIRDFCAEEFDFIQQNSNRITTFFDALIYDKKMAGESWSAICDEIIQPLPERVYISLDIDGLDPRFCPHTGTPVPGGLDFAEVTYLTKKLVLSGRTIVGFDLNEVSPGMTNLSSTHANPAAEWDANVGARILYKLCGWTLHSHHLIDR